MSRRGMLSLLVSGLLLACLGLPAASLPTPVFETQPELRSIGEETLHWFGLHVYDIALYARDPAYASNSMAALSIRYHISIKSHRLVETTLKEWRRMKLGEAVQHDRWARQLEALWPHVKPGDRLTAFKKNEGATQFYLNDRLLGEVSDPAFGPAFFAIWLDAACRYPKIKDGLLGRTIPEKRGR
jgi:hypothetical protein